MCLLRGLGGPAMATAIPEVVGMPSGPKGVPASSAGVRAVMARFGVSRPPPRLGLAGLLLAGLTLGNGELACVGERVKR